jgi:hypothetical protein
MFRRNQIFLPLLAAVAIAIAISGCSSTNSSSVHTPTGNYGNGDFSGLYALSVSGILNGTGFFTAAGSIQADGDGHITGGVLDCNGVSGPLLDMPITSGGYSITLDGRGQATLITASTSISLDFVLVANGNVLVTRFDSAGTASGTMSLQNTTAFSTPSGAFAFNLMGIDTSFSSELAAGNFSTSGVGSITSGTLDVNDFGAGTLDQSLIGSISSVASSSANGRGTLVLATPTQTLNFAFYIVDANHFKMIETDTPAEAPVLAGDAFTQPASISNASLSGPYAFTLKEPSFNTPYVAGGIITADGAGNISSGLMDVNNNGNLNQNLASTGSYVLASTRRGTLTLTNPVSGTLNFVIYPTATSGVLMMETDAMPFTSGAAYMQSGSFSTESLNGIYGYNGNGASNGDEIDSIAQWAADGGGSLSGTLDINSPTDAILSYNLALTGSYTIAANGRGTALLSSPIVQQGLIIYAVNGSQFLFIESDSNPITSGTIQEQ